MGTSRNVQGPSEVPISLSRQGLYEFGPFQLNPPERLLLRDGQPVALPPKAYDMLVTLVARAGRLVSAAELQALVGHEIGHEYFWGDFERTLERGDKRGRQELELKCDGIAVLTLIALGGDPASLRAGLRKQLRFNEAIGAIANADEYPVLQDRERFINAVRDLVLPSTRNGGTN